MKTAVLLTILLLPLPGCRVVSYQSPEGNKLFLGNLGFETNIGTLNVEKTADGTRVGVEGYKSDAAKALDLAKDLASKVK